MNEDLRIVVVDDSKPYRQILCRILERSDGVAIVGEFSNGRELLESIEEIAPDCILLDIAMPELDGLETLEAIRKLPIDPAPSVVIISGTCDSSDTLTALSLGALDVVAKPSEDSATKLGRELDRCIRLVRARRRRHEREAHRAHPREDATELRGLVVLAVSTGGPQALERVVPSLDASFGLPMLIVQHMPVGFIESLARSLSARCPLAVSVARAGVRPPPGEILIAPAGSHLEIGQSPYGLVTRLTEAPPVNGCRPAADRLFESVARCYDGPVLAVVMTGMGSDGLAGIRALREKGACCVAQNEASSVVYGMPRSVAEAGLADEVLPLEQIGPRIQRFSDELIGGTE